MIPASESTSPVKSARIGPDVSCIHEVAVPAGRPPDPGLLVSPGGRHAGRDHLLRAMRVSPTCRRSGGRDPQAAWHRIHADQGAGRELHRGPGRAAALLEEAGRPVPRHAGDPRQDPRGLVIDWVREQGPPAGGSSRFSAQPRSRRSANARSPVFSNTIASPGSSPRSWHQRIIPGCFGLRGRNTQVPY